MIEEKIYNNFIRPWNNSISLCFLFLGKTKIKMSSHESNMFLTMLWNKTPYVLLLILCTSQVIASLQTHSLVARLTLCDTILFTIAMVRRLFSKCQQNLDLFLRLAGIIAFEALIFVNFTHAMEIVFAEHHDTHISRKNGFKFF